MPMKEQKKRPYRLVRMSRVRAYLLIKSIKKQLREQERKISRRP